MRLTLGELRSLLGEILNEGGLKLPPEHRRELTPALVRQAAGVYRSFINGWNSWLESRGMDPVTAVKPTGSSTYADVDFEGGVDAVYGDIDYLVSFPVEYQPGADKRKAESDSEKMYVNMMVEYLSTERPEIVDIDMTLRSSPQLIIVRLHDGILVQVDTIITHPDYSDWMKGRYTPERGIKGYITGKLYKALGDSLMMQIGTEGVMVREKDGQRVPSKMKKGVTTRSISRNFGTFIMDIAHELLGDDFVPDPLLRAHPGLDPESVTVKDLALGIKGLANTMEAFGASGGEGMLRSVFDSFESGIQQALTRKVSMGITPEQERKLQALNTAQLERVQGIFAI